jgi:hypothetical protein
MSVPKALGVATAPYIIAYVDMDRGRTVEVPCADIDFGERFARLMRLPEYEIWQVFASAGRALVLRKMLEEPLYRTHL